ncbi:MAG: CoA transferase [Candidatus Tectomicrobia bacterium]|nr:CoA transferase [Candidatus Tectomicrobia bacterium]
MATALDDLRVLELGKSIATGYCTMLLADLGAEVVRIEQPDQTSKGLLTPLSLYLDRSKKGVTLDIAQEKGQAIFKELVKKSDIVVDSLREVGIEYEILKTLNPGIIHASLSTFGRNASQAPDGVHDLLAQAVSGYMSITGFPERPPTRSGQAISEYYAAIQCTISILAALQYRRVTGQGQFIDMALLDSLITAMEGVAEQYFLDGEVQNRSGNVTFGIGRTGYGVYKTADGYVALAVLYRNIWPRFCEAIERPELLQDPRLADLASRRAHSDLVKEIIEEWVSARRTDEIVETLTRGGVPAAPVQTIEALLRHPQVQAREMLTEVDHPQYGRLTVTGSPLKMSETPGKVRSAAPLAGEDNEEVYGRLLGYSHDDIVRLREQGII